MGMETLTSDDTYEHIYQCLEEYGQQMAKLIETLASLPLQIRKSLFFIVYLD